MRLSRYLARYACPLVLMALLALGLSTAAPVEAEQVTVTIGDNFFEPRTLTVNVGDTVTWVHQGQRPHDVTARGGAFESPRRMMNGQQFSYTATAPGTYEYVCTIHEAGGMTGTLIVRAAGAAPTGMPRTGVGDATASGLLWWLLLAASVGVFSIRLMRRCLR